MENSQIFKVEIQADAAIKTLAEYNNAIGKTTAQMSELKRANQQGSEEYAKLSQVLATQKRERNELQRVIQNSVKSQREEETSLRGMRATLSNLTRQYDQMSATERKSARGKELQTHINQITNELKAAEAETQRYNRNVGNYTNSILAAVGANGTLAQSLLGLNGAAVKGSAVLPALTSEVKALGAASMALLENPVFLAIAGIAGTAMAVSIWDDYATKISEATRLTQEFTGYSGAALNDLRNSIMATSEVMDKDYNEVLRATDAIMSHFHVSGTEAIEAINAGFAAGADLNGDMLSMVEQNSAALHDAGLNAREMMAVLAQTRSGIFGQDGLRVIQQGAVRIREMSNETKKSLEAIGINATKMQKDVLDGNMTLFEAMQQVGTAIKDLPDNAQEVGEAIKDTFGKTGRLAAQEMIEGLADISLNLDEVVAKTGDYGQLLLDEIDTQKEVEEAAAELFGVQGGGWEAVKKKAAVYFNRALAWGLNWANKFKIFTLEVTAGFYDTWNALVAGGKSAASVANFMISIAKRIGQAFADLGSVIANAVQGEWGAAASAWDRLKGLAANVKADFKATVKEMGGHYGSAAKKGANYRAWIHDSGDYSDAELYNNDNGNGNGNGNGREDWTSGSGNGSKGSGGGSKGSGRGSKSSGKKSNAEKEAAAQAQKEAKEREAIANRILQAAKRLQEQTLKEAAKVSEEGINAYYDAQIAGLKEQFDKLVNPTEEVVNAYNKLISDLENNRKKDLAEWFKKLEEDKAKAEAEQAEEIQKLQQQAYQEAADYFNARLDAVEKGSQEEMLLRLSMLDLQYRQEREKFADNAEMIEALNKAHISKQMEIEKEYNDASLAALEERYQAIAGAMGAASNMLEQFAGKSKAAAVASKVMAVSQIAIEQGLAIAKGVKSAMDVPFPANLGAIATTIAAVMAAITQALGAVKSAKFAVGGFVSGPGTSTSDSIPARLSNGESVINANSTALFAGLLSALNQVGGGVPIQAGTSNASIAGEAMLARAFAVGAAALPAPIVSVVDINQASARVVKINESATL